MKQHVSNNDILGGQYCNYSFSVTSVFQKNEYFDFQMNDGVVGGVV